MNLTAGTRGKPARGPDGCILTIADLPSPDTKRWVIRRKAIVAAAVRGGLISPEAACSRYRLNPEELLSWQYYIDRYGFSALRTTKVQSYVRPGQRKFGLGIRDHAPTHSGMSANVSTRGNQATRHQEQPFEKEAGQGSLR